MIVKKHLAFKTLGEKSFRITSTCEKSKYNSERKGKVGGAGEDLSKSRILTIFRTYLPQIHFEKERA